MPIRYSDISRKTAKTADFVSRRYNPSLLRLVVLFFLTLAICIGITSQLLSALNMIILLTLVMGGLGTYIIVEIQRLRDVITAAEFQNAMFGSALGYNSKFCLIVKREGTIIYMDKGLYKMFPDMLKERQFSISNLLKLAKVAPDDREKILDVVQRAKPNKMMFDIRSADNRVHPIVLTVQPIERPVGFLLLRGRDYVERSGPTTLLPSSQSASAVSNPLLSKASITMFASIIDRMAMGMYMIDMFGNMLYANPLLEKWLSFKPGEIIAGNFTMRDLVHGVSLEEALSPGDFEGENSLLKKEGGIIKAYINQKIIYGDNDKPLGCVALITNMVESDTESKKKLW